MDPILQVLDGPATAAPGRFERVKSQLGLAPSDTSRDDEIRATLLGVGAVMTAADLYGREPWRTTYRMRYPTPSGRELFMPRWPVESVASIRRGADPADNTELVTGFEIAGIDRDLLFHPRGWGGVGGVPVSSGRYSWSLDADHLFLAEWPWDEFPAVLTVEFTAGYRMPDDDPAQSPEASPLPEDLVLAVELTALEWLNGGLELPIGVVKESDPTGSTHFNPSAGDLPPVPAPARAIFRRAGSRYD